MHFNKKDKYEPCFICGKRAMKGEPFCITHARSTRARFPKDKDYYAQTKFVRDLQAAKKRSESGW